MGSLYAEILVGMLGGRVPGRYEDLGDLVVILQLPFLLMSASYTNRVRRVARTIMDLDNAKYLGPMVEFMNMEGIGSNAAPAYRVVAGLLRRVRASDSELIDQKQRAILRELLEQPIRRVRRRGIRVLYRTRVPLADVQIATMEAFA